MSVYYVKSGGSDAANGLSFANAWASIPYAASHISGGDELRICGTITETGTDGPLFTVSGSRTQPTVITGASSTDGSVDGSIGIYDGDSLTGNSDCFNLAGDYYVCKNLKGLNASNSGFEVFSGNRKGINFINCGIEGAGAAGFSLGGCLSATLVNCYVKDVQGDGIVGNAFGSPRANNIVCNACSVYNAGLNIGSGYYGISHLTDCLAINCSQAGISNSAMISNCTVHGNDNHGIEFTSDETGTAINCIITNNTGYGIYSATQSTHVAIRNSFRGNSSGETSGIRSVMMSISLSDLPYVNASGNNFNLHRTAAGKQCIDSAYPLVWPEINIANYGDLGAIYPPKPAVSRIE